MVEEIHDRFGAPSLEVRNLLGLMSLRLLLKKMRVRRLDVGRHSFTLTFAAEDPVDSEGLVRIVAGKPNMFRFLSQNKLKVYIGSFSPPDDLSRIEKAIEELVLH